MVKRCSSRVRADRFLRGLIAASSLLLAVPLAPSFSQAAEPQAEPPAAHVSHVAAAADLQFALPEIVSAFTRKGGGAIKLSFGSSGNFARQILQGAPFELFLSADERYAQQILTGGRGVGVGVPYALGRLVVFLPSVGGTPIKGDRDAVDLIAAVRDGRLQRLAMANPEHAPYGRAAREVLERLGIWAELQGKLALGDNAAQAAQFAASGAAQAGLIPLSLAQAPELRSKGSFVTVPENWHSPLQQTLVLIQGAGPTATALAAYLRTAEAQAILSRHGFGRPGALDLP